MDPILPNFDPYPPRMDKNWHWTYYLPSVMWPTVDFLVSTETNPFFFSTVPYFPRSYWMTPYMIIVICTASLSCTMFSFFQLLQSNSDWSTYLHYSVLTSVTLHITPEILQEIIERGPLCFTDLFQNYSVAYFNPK